MAKNNKKDLSKHVSVELDQVGYSREAIRDRINHMDKISKAKDLATKTILKDGTIQKIYVGSQRDGTGFCPKTDLDILQIYNSVVCVESINQINELNAETQPTILNMDKVSAPAGYTFLTVPGYSMNNYENSFHSSFRHAVTSINGQAYLSSDLFMNKNDDVFYGNDGVIGRQTCYLERKGPSIPKTIISSYLEYILFNTDGSSLQMDFVRAFPCMCDSLVDKWCERKRLNKWPSQKAIAHVRCLPVHVVPVGKKGSKNEDLQWRLSPTMAEIYLTKSFNNTQTKVFILLKLITKHILKPTCDDLSSYIVKNVMLWVCEAYPQKKFREKHLLSRLADALNLLKHSVQNNRLACYMIPERNLLDGKVSDTQRESLVLKIDQVLSQGQQILHKHFSNRPTDTEEYENALAPIYFGHLGNKICLNKSKMLTSEDIAEDTIAAYKIKTLIGLIIWRGFWLVPLMYRYGRKVCLADSICSKHHNPSKLRYLETEEGSIKGIQENNINMTRDDCIVPEDSNELSNKPSVCKHHHDNLIASVLLFAVCLILLYLYLYNLRKVTTSFTITLHAAMSLILFLLVMNQFWIRRYIQSNVKYDNHYPCVPLALYELRLLLLQLLAFLLIAKEVNFSTYILRYPIIFRDIATAISAHFKPVCGFGQVTSCSVQVYLSYMYILKHGKALTFK